MSDMYYVGNVKTLLLYTQPENELRSTTYNNEIGARSRYSISVHMYLGSRREDYRMITSSTIHLSVVYLYRLLLFRYGIDMICPTLFTKPLPHIVADVCIATAHVRMYLLTEDHVCLLYTSDAADE